MEFIRQAGCIQFDPVDVCGKNAELVLQSRIKRFSKEMLSDLLYQDRVLVDYFDKNLAIFSSCRLAVILSVTGSSTGSGREVMRQFMGLGVR